MYEKTFLVYRIFMRPAPPRPVRVCLVRTCCTVAGKDYDPRAFTLQCATKGHFALQLSRLKLLTSHCTLHTSHCTLHTPCFTSSHLSSSHLVLVHRISSHLISSHMSSKLFSTSLISSEHCSTFPISSKFFLSHLRPSVHRFFSAREKL